ncbi:hypothetical protein BG011_002931 [Mortierella polycephala]|uniref:Major facilitator superfamily (MFS) profile domain-containing protein n=1 Tax=Mortierella polycephala TaxID=41804 RepID=A0A9P6UA85_9FUNG|nr:hypothetical protein BG011_002931 [Mortierella polycephala]
MENATKNDNVVTVEVKDNLERESVKAEAYSNILDRANMTTKEFHWLWAGILIQAFTFSFEICVIQGIMSYITAFFTVTSLSSILPTVLQILAAALVPFYTKVSDVFGRAGSLTCAIFSYLLGLTIEGTAKTFVQFSIGQIFYGVGITGIQTLSQVLIADTTRLVDRGLMFALWDLGSAVNIWVAQVLIDPLTIPTEGGRLDKWRLGYLLMGVSSLIGAISLLAPLWHVQLKSSRRMVAKQPRRTIKWLLHEFDAVGALLITLGLSLTLLPIILAKSYEGNWRNGKILGMFVSGIVFFVLLVIWEVKFTDKPIMSMKIWTNRTAFGGLMIIFLLKIMGNVNWQYLTVYQVVSRDITFGQSYLLVRGFQMAWLVFQLLTGFLMKRYNTCRPFAWVGIVVYVIGVGLMIPARAPSASDAFIITSQTIAGAGGGMAHIAASVIVTGVVRRDDIAAVIGVSQILVSFGSALGNAMAGGLWTQYLPTRLKLHITGEYDESLAMNDPLEYISNLDPVMKSQLIEAYGDAQKLMSIICCCVAILACLCAALLKHVNLYQDQETQDCIATGKDVPDQVSEVKEKEEKH